MRYFYNINIPYGVRRGRKNSNVHKGVTIGRTSVEKRRCSYDWGFSIFWY